MARTRGGVGDDPVGGAGDAAEAKARVLRAFGQIAPTYGSGLELFDVFGRDVVAAAGILRRNNISNAEVQVGDAEHLELADEFL